MKLSAFAPAKVNLFLHVGAAGGDGYHPICSLMTFADVGDVVAVQPAETPEFEVTGPFSHELSDGDDNLVLRAAQALLQRTSGPRPYPCNRPLARCWRRWPTNPRPCWLA